MNLPTWVVLLMTNPLYFLNIHYLQGLYIFTSCNLLSATRFKLIAVLCVWHFAIIIYTLLQLNFLLAFDFTIVGKPSYQAFSPWQGASSLCAFCGQFTCKTSESLGNLLGWLKVDHRGSSFRFCVGYWDLFPLWGSGRGPSLSQDKADQIDLWKHDVLQMS